MRPNASDPRAPDITAQQSRAVAALLTRATVKGAAEAAGVDRATVMRRLHAAGIGTQVHFVPVHRQPYYLRRYGEQRHPGAEAYYARCLSLPLFAGMDERDVPRVVDALKDALDGAK